MDLAEFSKNLGSDKPVPGGGAAGGLTLSLAAACAQKAMVFSKPENYDEIQKFLENIRLDGLHFCEEDQRTFIEWQKARKLPKDTDEQKSFRTGEVNRTAAKCAAVPLATGKAAVLLISKLEELLPVCSKFLISDISCAASFAAAALQAACVNIEINLPYVKDIALLDEMNYFLRKSYSIANKKANDLIEQCRNKITN